MPTPLIPNAVRVTVIGSLFGQLVENVWFVQSGDPPTEADLNAICGEFQADYPGILSTLSNDLSYSNIVARYLGDAGGPEVSFPLSPVLTGGVTAASEPGIVAICVSLKTALAGRRFRGRKYFSGLVKSNVVGNALDATIADTIRNGVQLLRNGLATLGFPMTIVSLTGLTNVLVTNATLTDNFIDGQRRRLEGRGR